jgi:hypothetical protein
MPETANIARSQRPRTNRPPRFSTVEQFIAEYNKGSRLPIDLDPRVDFTKPVYEQVMALRAKDKAAEERIAKRSGHAKSK